MPLVGIVDPSHVERKSDQPGRVPKWFTTERLLELSRNATPKWSPWTYELSAAALAEWQERDYISTTMLTGGCMRAKVLERREDFVLELDDMYAALRGTQVHRTLEFTARPGALAEARFFTTFEVPNFGSVEVSCSPDLVTAHGHLSDYKAPTEHKGVPAYGNPWQNHIQQLEVNRYIVNNAERWDLPEGVELPWNPRTLNIEHLYVVYLGPTYPKVIEVLKTVEVPAKTREGMRNAKVPDIWTDQKVLDFVLPKLEGLMLALESYPSWPDGLETFPGFEGAPGWACPGYPWCRLPKCLAKRFPDGLVWENPVPKAKK